MRKGRIAALALAKLCAALIVFSLVAAGHAAELVTVQAGYGGIAGYQLPLWVNKEIGIYAAAPVDRPNGVVCSRVQGCKSSRPDLTLNSERRERLNL